MFVFPRLKSPAEITPVSQLGITALNTCTRAEGRRWVGDDGWLQIEKIHIVMEKEQLGKQGADGAQRLKKRIKYEDVIQRLHQVL